MRWGNRRRPTGGRRRRPRPDSLRAARPRRPARPLRPSAPALAPPQPEPAARLPNHPARSGRIRGDSIREPRQGQSERTVGRRLGDGPPLHHAAVGAHRVVGHERHVAETAVALKGVSDGALRRGPGDARPYSRHHHLEAAGRAHLVVQVSQQLQQPAHSDGIRPAHHQDDVGTAHELGSHGAPAGLQGVLVDRVVDRPATDINDRPGGQAAAATPHLGHGRGRKLTPAPGTPQAGQQALRLSDGNQELAQGLLIQPAMPRQACGGRQSGGVLRQSEDLGEARPLQVGVDEDRATCGSQAVSQRCRDRRPPVGAAGPPDHHDAAVRTIRPTRLGAGAMGRTAVGRIGRTPFGLCGRRGLLRRDGTVCAPGVVRHGRDRGLDGRQLGP